jgi:DNA-binding HxlR family transcriptional regulator
MTATTAGNVPLGGRTGARRSSCPVACALDIVGDRWTLLVIRDLFAGKTRYGDLLASAEKIPTNILAERLRRLEREGLIVRVPYSTRPPRMEYHLTSEGRQLGGAVDALARWGLTHCPDTVRNVWPSTESDESHTETPD